MQTVYITSIYKYVYDDKRSISLATTTDYILYASIQSWYEIIALKNEEFNLPDN